MATLTSSDFNEIQQIIKSDPVMSSAFKSWSLSRPTWMAVFQAVEDWLIGGFSTRPATSLKVAIDAVVGSSTVAQAKHIIVIWLKWRFNKVM
jgi:hypothetical protein